MALVVGIDASYAAIGWATASTKPEIIDSGVYRYSKRVLAAEQLPAIVRDITDLFNAIEDTHDHLGQGTVAIENSWLGRNFQTASKLAELRGVIVGLACSRGFRVERIEPRSWQTSARIPMRARRDAVKSQSLAIAQIRAPRTGMTEDEADAINIAWHAAGALRMRGAA